MPATPIYHLAYSSDASRPMAAELLQELLRQARAFNQANQLTGLLFYSEGLPGTSNPGSFFQVLEGEETTIRALLTRIGRDPRNTNLQVHMEGLAARRMFPDWAMGFLAVIPPDMEALTGYVNPREPRFLLPRAHAIGPELQALMQALLTEYPPWPYPST